MSPLTVLIAPQKVLVLDRLGGTAAAERRGAGPGEARQLGRVPLGLLELKSCFLLDLTESRHSAVPSGRGRRTQPFRGSAPAPTWPTPTERHLGSAARRQVLAAG